MATRQAKYASPQQTANKSFRLPFVSTFENRDGTLTKDQRVINCFAEVKKSEIADTKKTYLIKRPGLTLINQYPAGDARGCFRWGTDNYVAIGNTLYKNAVVHKILQGTTGRVGFTIVNDDYEDKLLFCDGTFVYMTNGTTVETIPTTYSAWATDTVITLGERRIPVAANGFYYECIVRTGDFKTHATTEPVWPTTLGDQVVDDAITWQCAGYYGYSIATWSTPRTVVAGAQIVPTVSNGFYYGCTVGGAVGGTEPVWPQTIGATVVDGAATWECLGLVDLSEPMPEGHLPYPVFLNNIVYLVAKNSDGTNSSSIYNSDIRNPSSWNQTDFIDAEQYPDRITAIARQHNYLAAFGEDSLEYFFDAGNPSGSPLSRNESMTAHVGCISPDSIIQHELYMMFIGTNNTGEFGVYQVVNYTPKKISDEFVERILAAEGSNIRYAKAFLIDSKGHELYVIHLVGKTIAYDINEKLWCQWTTNVASAHSNFVGAFSADYGDGRSMILGSENGSLYVLDSSVYQDNNTPILMDIYLSKQDFDSMNRKYMHELNLVGDYAAGQTIQIRWSDDDGTTWTPYLTLTFDADGSIGMNRLGIFRRRLFNILYTGNSDLRLESIECDVSLGDH